MLDFYIIIKKVFFSYIILKLSQFYKDQYNLSFSSFNNIPKISIFLPIYNKGKYLKKGIESLQAQTLKDIEIVAINDGSTDNSLKILKKLSKSDKRIKIINNDRNHGPFYSRAMGIINSTGEYMMNLDADDKLINYNSLKLIYNKITPINDGYLRYLINRIPVKSNETYYFDFLNKNQLNFEDFLISNKLVPREIYLKAYSFLEERIFGNKWIIHDDNIWNLLIRKFSNKSIIFDKYIYYYKRNEESLNTIRGSLTDLKSLVYRLDMFLKINEKLANKNFKDYLNQIIDYYNFRDFELPENEIKNNLHKIYFKYGKLNDLDYYYKKGINFNLEKLFDGKIIIFYDSSENQIITYLIQIILFLLYKKLPKKRVLFVDLKKISEVMNYIYYNDILIGINNVFLSNELDKVINRHPNNRLIIFSKILDKTFSEKFNIKKKRFFFNFLNKVPFDNLKNNFSEPIFHFISSSLISLEITLKYVRKQSINKLLFLFIDKREIENVRQNFKALKSKYSAIFKYIHYPINIINLIKIIKKYKYIITDSQSIAKLSASLFISCIVFEKNATDSEIPKLIYQMKYISPFRNINNMINNIEIIENKFRL